MTVQEASVLLRCVEARSVTPGRLAVGLGRDKGLITWSMIVFKTAASIARHLNPRDRRFSILKPTAKGKQTARDLARLFDEIERNSFSAC